MRNVIGSVSNGLLVGLTLTTGCSRIEPAESDAKYLLAPHQQYGFMASITEPSIDICFDHEQAAKGDEAYDKWLDMTRDAVLAWIEPLRAIANKPLSETIEFRDRDTEGCADTDGSITFNDELVLESTAGAEAYFSTNHPKIHFNATRVVELKGEDGQFGYLLHEVGHGFGLSDTYYRDPKTKDTYCQWGQPDSLMCSADFDDLTPDDLNGLKHAFHLGRPELARKNSPDLRSGIYRPTMESLCQEWAVAPKVENGELASITITYCGETDTYQCEGTRCTTDQYVIEDVLADSFSFWMNGLIYTLRLDPGA